MPGKTANAILKTCESDLAKNETVLTWSHSKPGVVAEFIIERATVSQPTQFIEIARIPAALCTYTDKHGATDEVGHYYRIRTFPKTGEEASNPQARFSKIPILQSGLRGNYDPNAAFTIDRDYKLSDAMGTVIGVRMWVKKSSELVGNPEGCVRSRAINLLCENYGKPGTNDEKLWASEDGNCPSGLNRVFVFLFQTPKTWCELVNQEKKEGTIPICIASDDIVSNSASPDKKTRAK